MKRVRRKQKEVLELQPLCSEGEVTLRGAFVAFTRLFADQCRGHRRAILMFWLCLLQTIPEGEPGTPGFGTELQVSDSESGMGWSLVAAHPSAALSERPSL